MSQRKRLWSAILVVGAIVRIFTLSAYPLHDTTEARYAEVARLMLTSGDWITPQISAGVPFWGKPPLSFWLTATSFKLFGLNEFAARLPAFLLLLVVVLLVYYLVRMTLSIDTALGAAAIILTSAIGFIASGAVMTDASLLLGTTLSMVAFWRAAILQQTRWRYLFFIGIAFGLLAKGPIALILTAAPVLLWLLYNKSVAWSLRCMPWISGLLVMLITTAPWYAIAESKTPGFLEYFLVGEHWHRYIDSGWAGDLYGSAHAQPRGIIWLFGIAAALPWSLVALYAIGRFWQTGSNLRKLTPLQTYLLLWTLTPLLVFTLAGNILPAYVLSGIPAFAMLLSDWLTHRNRKILHVAWFVPLLVVTPYLTTSFDAVAAKSQKALITHYSTLARSEKIIYFPVRPFSAGFYSRGEAQEIQTESALLEFLHAPGTEFVAIHRTRLMVLPDDVASCLRHEAEFSTHVLFEKLAEKCD